MGATESSGSEETHLGGGSPAADPPPAFGTGAIPISHLLHDGPVRPSAAEYFAADANLLEIAADAIDYAVTVMLPAPLTCCRPRRSRAPRRCSRICGVSSPT